MPRCDAAIHAVHGDLFRDIPACTHLLFAVKNLERTGEHVTNIAESIWLATEGGPDSAPTC